MPRAFTPVERATIRRRLLEAGRAALATTGFRKTSVDQLTRAAGISKGAFYRFFPDKTAVWVAVLGEAEQDARARLRALLDAPLDRVTLGRQTLRTLFAALNDHPILRALADPDELSWLLRALPPGHLEAAQRDDDAFFSALYRDLVARGAFAPGHEAAFCALPGTALALIQGRALIGEGRFDPAVAFQVEAWLARLSQPPRGSAPP